VTPGTAVSRRSAGLTFRRRFRRPPAAVFAAFADPALLVRWWGPPECPVVQSAMDFRPGGVWHYRSRSARSGSEAWSRAVFDPDRLIVFTETSSDADGAVTADRAPARTTVEIAPDGDGTLLVIDVQHDSEPETIRAIGRGVERGLSRALDQLDALIDHPPREATT
jgi:uncharacterized protein YndB with AHSA1/START domain